MSLRIEKINQIDSGGNNPKTNLFEQPIWELTLENGERRLLGKYKVEEYLSKGYDNSVHQFKRWSVTSTSGAELYLWAIIFSDKSHDMCVTQRFLEKLYQGHVRKDEEKYKNYEKVKAETHPVNPVLFTERKSLTTDEERKELDEYRNQIKESPY
jgi:hypothetical protein